MISKGTGANFETTGPLGVTAATQARIVGGSLELSTRGSPTTLQIHRVVTQRDGSTTRSDRFLPMRAMQ